MHAINEFILKNHFYKRLSFKGKLTVKINIENMKRADWSM